jgi:hypothetical protein
MAMKDFSCACTACFLSCALIVAVPFALLGDGTKSAASQTPVANVFSQGFPAKEFNPARVADSDTAWEIAWEITNPTNGPKRKNKKPSSVLRIAWAKFTYKDKDNQSRRITVLRNLELGEVFVPYDPGKPKYKDVDGSREKFWIMAADPELLGPDCLAKGEILPSHDPDMRNKVYKEVHYDGLRWLRDDGGIKPDRGRRGEKMLIWAVFYADNYRYIIEYGFSDDGRITCRLGATARNLDDAQKVAHLHVGCWMFQPDLGDPDRPDLGGPDKNVVQLVSRVPKNPGAKDGKFRVDVRPFGTPPGTAKGQPALEGSADWAAEEFTTLRIESTARKNGNNKPQPTAYDVVPLRYGSVRDFPDDFQFANKDFWVTREIANPVYVKFPEYVRAARTIDQTRVIVGHNSALLHVPRAEDLGPDGKLNRPYVALTAWAGFMLRPRNLFDSTPLFKRDK